MEIIRIDRFDSSRIRLRPEHISYASDSVPEGIFFPPLWIPMILPSPAGKYRGMEYSLTLIREGTNERAFVRRNENGRYCPTSKKKKNTNNSNTK